MPIKEADSWQCGPLWVRQRALGKRSARRMRTSVDLMKRLRQEACLEGHMGCVNCLEWNQQGDLLASGSDDCNVIIWNAFKKTKQSVVKTGHHGNIFSVKFMPGTHDTQVATCAGGGQVRVNGTLNSETLLACKDCHSSDLQVKRLAVHLDEPNLIWSAGEDGYIMQYDTREKHECEFAKPKNLLIDLNIINNRMAAKCIAVNPVRSEMLAVGSNDIYNRLFDRRYIRKDSSKSCTAYFAPGHLHRSNNRPNNIQCYGTTYLAFNSSGSELLASVHAEQVYLYNTYEPWERYRSFEVSVKPLMLDKPETNTYNPLKLRPFSFLNQLRDLQPAELNDELAAICKDLWLGQSTKSTNATISHLNESLVKISNSPDLYRARAIALTTRNWRGDYYQALRDCCCALALKPLDWKTIRCLATVLVKLGDRKAVCGLLGFVDNALVEFGPIEELLRSRELLIAFKRSPSPTHSQGFFDDNDSKMSDFSSSSGRLSPSDECSNMYHHDYVTLSELRRREVLNCSRAYDFSKRFCGHCNMNTDIKEANFFGSNDEFVVGGSDDGAFYIWEKDTCNILKAVNADYQILNCVQPHPNICMLATSGIGTTVKLWSANGKLCRDVEALETRCLQNQKYIQTDPLEAMYMMLYPEAND